MSLLIVFFPESGIKWLIQKQFSFLIALLYFLLPNLYNDGRFCTILSKILNVKLLLYKREGDILTLEKRSKQ